MVRLIVSFLFFSLISCNTINKEKINSEDISNCDTLKSKYLEFGMKNEKDSTLKYLNKAIDCDPDDDFLFSERIRILIQYEEYEEALRYLKDNNNKEEPTSYFIYGVLLLHENDSAFKSVLKKADLLITHETNSYSKSNSILHYYKIGLDNYFKGSDYALRKVKLFEENYSDEYENQLSKYLKVIIPHETKESVLFRMIGLEDKDN